MTYPAGLPTKQVSFGAAVVMESGQPLAMRVTISSSRSCVYRPLGVPLIHAPSLFPSDGTGNGVITLPICDSPDMGPGDGTSFVLDADHPVTHTYQAQVDYFTDSTFKTMITGQSRTIPVFAVLSTSDDVSDIDDLAIDGAPVQSGEAYTVPDVYVNDVLSNPSSTSAQTVSGMITAQAGALTASDVGARPDTWTPTAAEVGARADTWVPTDADLPTRLSDASLSAAYADKAGTTTALAAKVNTSSVGAASGVASLDSAGKVLVGQLPTGMMQLKGSWNASTNTPALADGTGSVGAYYRVSVAGTQNLGSGSQSFAVGDFVIYNDVNQWELSHSGADVMQSVAGLTGTVTASALKTALALVKGDVGLGNVDNTSDANKPVSTAQQTALDAKAPLASPALTGTPTAPTATAGTSTTQVATTAFVAAAVAAAGVGGVDPANELLIGASINHNLINTATANVGAALDNLRQLDGLATSSALRSCATYAAVKANSTALSAAAASPTCVALVPSLAIYAATIGQAMYGGYYAGVIDTTTGNIIAADHYQSGAHYALILSPESYDVASEAWQTSSSLLVGAETRWDGLSATNALKAAGVSPAANYCVGLTAPSDGGSQWYLPAMDEMELIYRNFKPTTESNYTNANSGSTFPGTSQAPGYNPSSSPAGAAYTTSSPARTALTDFQAGGVNALQGVSGTSIYYWTSSVSSSTAAWIQGVSGSNAGIEYYNGVQTATYRVRPVRRIVL